MGLIFVGFFLNISLCVCVCVWVCVGVCLCLCVCVSVCVYVIYHYQLSLLLDYNLYDLDCDLSSNENRFYVIRLFVQNKELPPPKKKVKTKI